MTLLSRRGRISSTLFALSITFAACGSGDSTDGAPAGTTAGSADGGLSADGNATRASDGSSVGNDGGPNGNGCLALKVTCDNERDCCDGFCPGHACSSQNVVTGASCTAPAPCGGDPSGSWHLVGGCAAPKTACAAEGKGAVVGDDLTISGSGPSNQTNFQYDLHACGWVSQGGRNVDVPNGWNTDAFAPGGWPYCVDGTTLWIFPPHNGDPEVYLTALKYMR